MVRLEAIIVAVLLLVHCTGAFTLSHGREEGVIEDAGPTRTNASLRRLKLTDYIGSDPVGSDTVGNGAKLSPSPSPSPAASLAAPSPATTAAPAPSSTTEGGALVEVPPLPAAGVAAGAPALEGSQACTTPLQYMEGRPDLSISASLFKAAGIPSLSDASAVQMVFVPTDSAWEQEFQGLKLSEEGLKGDPQLLQALMPAHVAPERAIASPKWTDSDAFPLLPPGQSLEIHLSTVGDNTTYVTGLGVVGYPLAPIKEADIPVCQGLLYTLGSVVLSEAADKLLLARGTLG